MPEEKTNTENQAGAGPGDKTATADPSTAADKDGKTASSTEGEPWHKDPRFKQDLGLLKAAKSLMEKNKLDSVEDLVDLIESGNKIKGKQIDLERIDEIAAKAEKLDKYEAYWADQAEKKRREVESESETIARLEAELRNRDAYHRSREAQRQETERAKQAVDSYESEVKAIVRDDEIPKEQRDFYHKLLGVNNPSNEIDITDRKAVRKAYADLKKDLDSFKQAVIADYLKGKEGVVKVGTTQGSTVSDTKPKIMLKDARRIFLETMQKASGG